MIMLALEIPILLIFLFIDFYRTRNLSFKERLKKRWFPYAIVALVFFVPRFINDHYFEEVHGRKFGRPEGEGNPEHHSIDYDRCLRNASLLTVGFCEWISGDYSKTVESECIDNQIFSSGLCNVKLKEKYRSLETDEKKLEYTKYVLKQLEQKQTDYSEKALAKVASTISLFSDSREVNMYLSKYSLDRCYNKNEYFMCFVIYDSYSIAFPYSHNTALHILSNGLELYFADSFPSKVNEIRRKNVIELINSRYRYLRQNKSDREIEDDIKSVFKNMAIDVPEEVMLYYKNALSDK